LGISIITISITDDLLPYLQRLENVQIIHWRKTIMKEIIRKRKSIRKYDMDKLDTTTLDKVHDQIKSLLPLYPDIPYSIEIAEKTKGLFNIKAPHYLIFGSEKKEGYLENIGFIGQQLDLFLSENELGAVWLGVAKPTEKVDSDLPFVIAIGFGKAAEPLHRNLSDFKRKPLSDISEGKDTRLEAARLAPSGMNAQNWYFVATDGKIHCYCKRARLGFLSRMAAIDMGIALSHIMLESENFQFAKESHVSERKGYIYMGTVL
jgi:hypothetical protein